MHVCHIYAVPVEVRRGHLIPSNWSCRCLTAFIWVLGTEFRSSAEQQVQLTAEPSLQLFKAFFIRVPFLLRSALFFSCPVSVTQPAPSLFAVFGDLNKGPTPFITFTNLMKIFSMMCVFWLFISFLSFSLSPSLPSFHPSFFLSSSLPFVVG